MTDDNPATAVTHKPPHLCIKVECGAEFAVFLHECIAHPSIVHNAFLRYAQAGDATDVGLDFPHGVTLQPYKPLKPVLAATLVQDAEPCDFLVTRSHHQLATDLMLDSVLLTKRDHLTDAGNSKTRLQGTGPVIKASMQNAAVMRTLVPAKNRLFLQ